MLRFQIIEKIKTDDILNQDQGLIRKGRLERELYWIAKLRTAYPLGLNDRLQALGIAGNAPDRPLPLTRILPFSQPLSDNIGPRFNTYSQ